MFQLGDIVGGRLRIDQILGAGGMGVVAAATHVELGHRVAVKVLRDELAQNPTTVERFIREARSVVHLRTEHVCRVFDVGRLDSGVPYIVMELLEGNDLARLVAKRPLPVNTAVDYVIQACAALAEAHAAGIVHRDLKPANLFVTRRLDGGPLVKVLDFGIAKAMVETGPQLTSAGMMGSPGYMSPEQLVSAHDVDFRTDIWALGVTLYQLVSARMPFAGANLTEIAVKVASDPPAPLEVDPNLLAVILRCLDKQPDRRYPSVAALALDLVRFASSDGRKTAAMTTLLGGTSIPTLLPAPPVATSAPTTASQAPTTTPVARTRWPLLAGGAIVLVAATIAITLAARGGDSRTTVIEARTGSGSGSGSGSDVVHAVEPPRVVDPARGSNVDPWEARETAPEPDAAPEPDVEEASMPGPLGLERQMQQQTRVVLESCRKTVSNPQIADLPLARPGVLLCWCMLGDAAQAQIVFKKMSKEQRGQIAPACKQYGIVLRD